MTVLLADEIKRLCDVADKSKAMIDPFCPSRLRPASYQLTLGEEIHIWGENRRLAEAGFVELAPHQVAVVSTHETIRLPGNLIARWSLRVTNIYEGLLWTGGPQVDPGWEGPLYCPIYNLAERTITLKCGEPLFTMDFVRTTDDMSADYEQLKDDPKLPEIPFYAKRKSLVEHDRHRLRSAPYELIEQVRVLRKESAGASKNVEQLANRMATYALIMFAVLAMIISALALIVSAQSIEFTLSIPIAVAIVLSILAILLAGFAVFRPSQSSKVS